MPFAQYSGKKASSRWGAPSVPESSDDLERINRQIDNAQTRIQDAGYTVQDSDNRNWLEKATNLPQGQNWFFDTLELLGRPANAVKNVIDKSIGSNKSQGVAKAAWRGLSGQDKVSGSDLAEKAGVTNKAGKFLLGTALDIGLDPVTYIPGAAIAKGAKGAGSAALAPLKSGYEALETIAPALKTARETKLTPTVEKTKDALGYMFDPDYKKTETLFGGQNDFLKNLERETEDVRRFMQEEAMKNVIDNAKNTGLEAGPSVGRIMESSLKQFDDAGNPLQRIAREVSSDNRVKEAAANLTRSNQMLRQYALDNGININEMEGYMTHVWSQAERNLRKQGKVFSIDQGRFGTGSPNKKILNERKLHGSAEDVNEQLGRNFFEPNAYFATAIGQRRLIDYIQAAQFRRKVLSNPDFAVKFEKGMDLPNNAVVIDTNNYKFLKDSGDILDGIGLADEVGGKYVVTKAAKQALDRFQRINTDEGTKAFMKAYSNLQNTWKKFALFSPGYHARNFVGNLWNSYAAGMRPDQLTKYTSQSIGEVTNALRGKESKIFTEFRKQGLLMSGLTKVEFGPNTDLEKGIEQAVKYMSKTGAAKVGQKINPINWFQSSRELGETADMINRFAMYKWARDKGAEPKQAAAKVREALFDYMDLTPFEQRVMKNIFPFYTWSRKNIPFQIKSFIENPDRFQKLNYVRTNLQENTGLDEEILPDYMKENFYMPIYGKDGKGKMLGLNLPAGDLTKLADPLKLGVDLTTPLIKTPIELATNFNTFRKKKIKEFEGQEKKLQIPFTDIDFGIPIKAAYALEQATGQVGRGMSSFLQKSENEDQDNKFRMPTMGISSFVKDFDVEKYNYYSSLDELKKLQDLIRYIEQQEGQKPRTLAEIKKAAQ